MTLQERHDHFARKGDRELADMIRNGTLNHAAARKTLIARGKQSMITEADRVK